jgi:hypothetical protein
MNKNQAIGRHHFQLTSNNVLIFLAYSLFASAFGC